MAPFIQLLLLWILSFPSKRAENAYSNTESLKIIFENSDWSMVKENSPVNKGSITIQNRLNILQAQLMAGEVDSVLAELETIRPLDGTSLEKELVKIKSKALMIVKDTASVISTLKNAIAQDIIDEEIMYNFELLKKTFSNSQNRPPQNQDQNQTDKNKGGIASKSDEREDELNTVDLPKIERSQALQILEALKNNQLLFIPNTSADTTTYGKY